MTPDEIARFDALRDEYRTIGREIHALCKRSRVPGTQVIAVTGVERERYENAIFRATEIKEELVHMFMGPELVDAFDKLLVDHEPMVH